MADPYWLGTIQLNRHNLNDLAWRVRESGNVSEAIDSVHAWVQSHVGGLDMNQLGITKAIYGEELPEATS